MDTDNLRLGQIMGIELVIIRCVCCSHNRRLMVKELFAASCPFEKRQDL